MERKKNNVIYILIAGIIILLGSAFFLFYTNLQQKQQTTSKATEQCHNGFPPLPIDPDCGTVGNPQSCHSPRQGYCKAKGACFECYTTTRGVISVCPCITQSPTPTPPQKEVCSPPYQCLPVEECVPDSIRKSTGVGTTVDTGNSCGVNSYCCIKKQPTPTTSVCPPVGTVGKVEVSCPLCETK